MLKVHYSASSGSFVHEKIMLTFLTKLFLVHLAKYILTKFTPGRLIEQYVKLFPEGCFVMERYV